MALGGSLLQVLVVEKRSAWRRAAPNTGSAQACPGAPVLLRKDWHPCFRCCQPGEPRQLQLPPVVWGWRVFFKALPKWFPKTHLTQSADTGTLLLQVTQDKPQAQWMQGT